MVPDNHYVVATHSSSTVLDTISVRVIHLSYSGTCQSMYFKCTHNFIGHLDVHMAPLKVFLYLKEILFFQVE